MQEPLNGKSWCPPKNLRNIDDRGAGALLKSLEASVAFGYRNHVAVATRNPMSPRPREQRGACDGAAGEPNAALTQNTWATSAAALRKNYKGAIEPGCAVGRNDCRTIKRRNPC